MRVVIVTAEVLLLMSVGLTSIAAQDQIAAKPDAGQVPPSIVVRVGVDLVQVDAVVTDSKGRQVIDLQKDDFDLTEKGKRRQISHFQYVASVSGSDVARTQASIASAPPDAARLGNRSPRYMAIVVDDLSLSFESVVRTRNILSKLVREQLGDQDVVAVLRTGGGMGSFEQFTGDLRSLLAAIDQIHFNLAGRGQVSGIVPAEQKPTLVDDPTKASAEEFQAGTRRMDRERQVHLAEGTVGALESVVAGLRRMPGRKALVLVSEGFVLFRERGSMTGSSGQLEPTGIPDRLHALVNSANLGSIVVYSIDPGGLQSQRADAAAGAPVDARAATNAVVETRTGLTTLASDTGGFARFDTNDLGRALTDVLDDQKGYYLLGFEPDAADFPLDGKRPRYLSIAVKVRRPDLRVRSRRGFYAQGESSAPPSAAIELSQLLTSPLAASDVPVRLTPLFNYASGQSSLRCLVHMDARALTFVAEADGSSTTHLEAGALAVGADGRVRERRGGAYTLRVPRDAIENALRGGLVLTLDLPLNGTGAYQIRAGVRDIASGRAGLASHFVDVPNLARGSFALSGIMMSGAEAIPVAVDSSPGAGGPEVPVDPDSTAAVRRFRRGATVAYALAAYNARPDSTTRRPQLAVGLHLYCDGRLVQSIPRVSVQLSQPSVPDVAVGLGSALTLGKDLVPGSYTLEVSVTDELRGTKARSAIQWVDFEVVS